MSNAVDWDNGPSTATHYGGGKFWRVQDGENGWERECAGSWVHVKNLDIPHMFVDYQPRPSPQEKPMKYEYGVEYPTNGVKPDLPDDVLVEVSVRNHYGFTGKFSVSERMEWNATESFRIVDDRYKSATAPTTPTTAAEYLSACAQVQLERGKQYDASGTGERSFDAAAEAFNCITGKQLRGSDVCLILELVKKVRQYSDLTRLHADSVLDAVSYGALWAEELTKELGK